MRPASYRDSFWVRGETSDPLVALSVFASKEYKTPYLDEIELILDLGGNVGYSAIYFAHHYPNAQIVVIEPHYENYQILLKNIKPYPNITARQAGLWWRAGELVVEDGKQESWGYRFKESAQHGVACVTMKELIQQYGQGKSIMVKMDVEGAEKEVFEKDGSWLNDVRVLQLEIHGCWKSVFDVLVHYPYQAEISIENVVIDLSEKPVHPKD